MNKLCAELHERLGYVMDAAVLEMAMVDSIGLGFSDAANSAHGLPAFVALTSAMLVHDAYTSDVSKLLAFEAAKRVPRDAVPGLRTPTLQWGLGMFDGAGQDRLEGACNRALDALIRTLLERGVVPGANLVGAYDAHSSPCHGMTKNPDPAAPGRRNAGAGSPARFMTGAAVSGPYTISTAFCGMKRGMTNAECVARMLDDEKRRGLDFLYTVWDKEYCSVGAMIECGKRNRHFLMRAVETPKVKKAIESYKKGGRGRAGEFAVGSGRRKFSGSLAMVERTRHKKGKKVTDILPFFSNMPIDLLNAALDGLQLEMERRRGAEAGYRRIEAAMPLATSTRPAVRTYMFWRALAATNLWALVDFEIKAARCAREGEAFPPAAWSDKRKAGDMSDTVLPGGFDITLKEFFSLYLTVCTTLVVMDRKEQSACAKAAVERFGHLFKPAAEAKAAAAPAAAPVDAMAQPA